MCLEVVANFEYELSALHFVVAQLRLPKLLLAVRYDFLHDQPEQLVPEPRHKRHIQFGIEQFADNSEESHLVGKVVLAFPLPHEASRRGRRNQGLEKTLKHHCLFLLSEGLNGNRVKSDSLSSEGGFGEEGVEAEELPGEGQHFEESSQHGIRSGLQQLNELVFVT